MEPETAGAAWRHASLKLVQPGWPGTTPASWVAATSEGELFRSTDVLSAMDRLGADGWTLVLFAPETGDRQSCFYFRAPRRAIP